MENQLESMINRSARMLGVSLDAPEVSEARKLGLLALADGRDVDEAFDLARLALTRHQSALSAA